MRRTLIALALAFGGIAGTASSAEADPALPTRGPLACAQWHGVARAAGFSEAQWPRVARIMWRESRCRPGAHNRSGAHGLMQVMPGWRRKPACRDLSSGAGNLRCARYILRVQGWGAWSATNG